MALQLEITNNPHGINPVPNAYHRVITFAANIPKQELEILVAIWFDIDARKAGKEPIQYKRISIGPSRGPDVVNDQGEVISAGLPSFSDLIGIANPQGASAFASMQGAIYSFLKALPEYEEAVDV